MKASLILIGVVAAAPLARCQTVADQDLQVREVASGLSAPTTMAFLGTNDILVLEKATGRVRRVLDGVLLPDAVLTLNVDGTGERGLLGIATHPQFPAVPFVYLYYTASVGPVNRVQRFTWDGSLLGAAVTILELPATAFHHNGGIVLFGPDGKLYIVIGDQQRMGQLQNFPNGPVPDDTGVILRLNANGSVPTDNPFVAQGGNLARYFAFGIRNSFGLAFDALTGSLWDTENGPASYDEVNRVVPGFNSGWAQITGPDARDPEGIGDLFFVPGSHYADPEFSWLSVVAPTAITFLHSARLGARYEDHLFVGDYLSGSIYHFVPNAARTGFVFTNPGLVDKVADGPGELSELVFGTGFGGEGGIGLHNNFGGITDLEVGPDGLLYVVSTGLGKVFAISRLGSDAIVDLALVQRESSDPVSQDGNLTYTLTLTNLSSEAATGVTITDRLPAQSSLVSLSAGCTNRNGIVTCDMGSVAHTVSATITIRAPFPASGTLTNTASVAANESDPVPINNTTVEVTTVVPTRTDLSATQTAGPNPVVLSNELVYTVTVVNHGPAAALSVTLTNSLPPGVSFVSASLGCTNLGGIVHCDLGGMADNAVRSVTITVLPTELGRVTNVVTVSSTQFDAFPVNNTSALSVRVQPLLCPEFSPSWKKLTKKCRTRGDTMQCELNGKMLILNSGQAGAVSSTMRIYISADEVLDVQEDQLLQSIPVPVLLPGKTAKAKLKAPLPIGMLASQHFVLAVMDTVNVVPECRETDNLVVFGPLP